MKLNLSYPKYALWLWTILGCFAAQASPLKVVPNASGIYHGAFPDLTSPLPVFFESYKINQLETKLVKSLAWVQIQDDFVDGIFFPWEAAEFIGNLSKIPYIRLMPMSRRQQNTGSDPIYSLRNILRGDFDYDLREYARQAKSFGYPIIIEFAPEANGRWYPWNGLWNGGGTTNGYGDPNLPDGPERYRDAYRHVVDLFNYENADNVTWVFHIDSQAKPVAPWNTMAQYYPGDDYVDWIGISVFGAQTVWDYWSSFSEVLDPVYDELAALSIDKPLSIAEFGVIEDPNDPNRKANWLREAMTTIRDGRYPRVQAVSYWHEHSWLPTNDNNLRLDSSPQALRAYNNLLADPIFLGVADVTWPTE